MSHELTQTNGVTEFAYLASDGAPWHGLGKAMDDGMGVDAWREAAGMDWRIHRSRVRYATCANAGPHEFIEVPESHVLFRSDNKEPLGVVSDKYKVVQPAEVLEFFRDIAAVGGLALSAAGTIYGGKRFWATAKIGEASPASLRDKIGGYLLISTSADGSMATEVRRTTIRTVCRNTLAMAMNDAPASIKVSHRTTFNPTGVKEFMGVNNAAFDAFVHKLEVLANKDLRLDRAEALAVEAFGGTDDKVRASVGFHKVMDLFTGQGMGAQEDGVYGTAWGFVNAFSEYADHWTRARTADSRLAASQWGAGAALKQKALELAEGV